MTPAPAAGTTPRRRRNLREAAEAVRLAESLERDGQKPERRERGRKARKAVGPQTIDRDPGKSIAGRKI
jgi:hypothetical protein